MEGFAQQIMAAGDDFAADPSGADEMAAWSRVLSAFPEIPARMREAVRLDEEEYRAMQADADADAQRTLRVG